MQSGEEEGADGVSAGSAEMRFGRGKLEYWKDQLEGFMTNSLRQQATAAETSMEQEKWSCLESLRLVQDGKWTGFEEELKWEMGGWGKGSRRTPE